MNQIPRNEYPRPDFKRGLWQCLNGEWEFAFDNAGESADRVVFESRILVPFVYQVPMSGIGLEEIHETVWYRRHFTTEAGWQGKRITLHFGAVDYRAEVYLNGRFLGSHEGGYTPFHFEVTGCLAEDNVLIVKVTDSCDVTQPRGKQFWQQPVSRCWYTGSTGIWQSVWLEATAGKRIDLVRFTPDIDNNLVEAEITVGEYVPGDSLDLAVSYKGRLVKTMTVSLDYIYSKVTIDLLEDDFIDEVHYWCPDEPNLYGVKLTLKSGGQTADEVESYFGMRKIEVENGRVLLNNRPFYSKLILDQGYWRVSGLTPPSDDAIKSDIEMTKKYGFNGARKHQKIEDPRYYYWADVLGLVVWGEVPSAYKFNTKEISNLTRDFQEFVKRDYNHPSLVAWVPLNESWGIRKMLTDPSQQHFGEAMYHLAKAMDKTRIISTNDGWENVKTDIISIHDYCGTGKEIAEKYTPEALENPEDIYPMIRRLYGRGQAYTGGAFMVTEYGGIALKGQIDGENWGYGGAENDADDLIRRYADVTGAIMKIEKIQGFCYTQLTDVFQEVNGLLDFDHTPKVDFEPIRKINSQK